MPDQVLLVEPCDMVRQVLTLALRAWGTAVCAVKSDEEAISHLKLRSELPTWHSSSCHIQNCQLTCTPTSFGLALDIM